MTINCPWASKCGLLENAKKHFGSAFVVGLSSYPRQKCTYRTQLAWQCFLLVMLAPVLLKLHRTIQQINIRETNCIIHQLGIYPVDNFIHLFNNWGLVYEDRTLVAWMIFPKVAVKSLPLGFMPWLLSCLQCTVLKLVDSASPPLLSHSNFYFSLPQLLSFQLQQAMEQSDVPVTSIIFSPSNIGTYQENSLWELMKWSLKGNFFDL